MKKSRWDLGVGPWMQHASEAAAHVTEAVGPRPRKWLKRLSIAAAVVIVLSGALLIAFRIVLSHAPEYRAQVQEWVSARTGLDIQFAKLDARWQFYGPELVFDDALVRSRDGQRELVSARRVSVGFDVWTAIGTFRLAAGRITLDKPELQVIRTLDGRIEVVGQRDLPERDPTVQFKPDSIPTGRLVVRDAQVLLRDLKTGRGPWTIPGVSFDLKRRGRSMHLEGEAELPAKLGKSLRFVADTAGRLAEAQELEWNFNINAREVDLAGWADMSGNDWPAPPLGIGSFDVDGKFYGTQVSDLQAKVDFANVELLVPSWQLPIPEPATMQAYVDKDAVAVASTQPAVEAETSIQDAELAPAALPPKFVKYDRIAFELQLNATRSPSGETWNARVSHLDLSRPNSQWRPSAVTASFSRLSSGGMTASAQADMLVLENLWPLLAYAPESKALAHVRALNASGRIANLEGKLTRATADAPLKYEVRARLSGVGIQAIAKAPGIANLSGLIEGNDEAGRFELNMRDGSLDLPRYFRTPLPVQRVAGVLQWRHDETGIRIETSEVLVDSPDGHARASGAVLVPLDGSSPQADVRAQGWDLLAKSAPRYMPVSELPPKVLEWLDRAFVDGAVPEAEFVLQGPTRSFPFRNGEGLFLITAHIEGLTLDYQPGWIPATNLAVDAEFRNEGMSAKLLKGDVNGLPLLSGTGRFRDFKQAELLLDAKVAGDVHAGLTYVQQSPVGEALGEQFLALSGDGQLQGEVSLQLPFKDIDARKLKVDTAIDNATVSHRAVEQSVTGLRGTLSVRDHALASINMQGRFLGGALTVRGGAPGRYTGPGAAVRITAQGRARGGALAALSHLPDSIDINGTMQWALVAEAPRRGPDDPVQVEYRLTSDTKGLAIGLPEPLGKPASTSRELVVDLDATRSDTMLVRGTFGSARALVRLRKDETQGWLLDRGGVRVDGIAAALPAHDGIRIEGTIERFVLDDWLRLKSSAPGPGELSQYLRAANVRVNSFGFMGFTWPAVRGILQATDDVWRVDIAADDIAGQLDIPFRLEQGAPLRVALSKLNVVMPEKLHDERLDSRGADPRDIPAIAGRIDEFSLSGHKVGIARFELDKTPRGVVLKSGELRGNSFTATANGNWLVNQNGDPIVSLVLDVASTDVRDTLLAFDFRDLITGKRANAHFALSWPGGIDEDLLGRASGSVHIEMSDGQLLGVDPGGAGRMLGLLSIGALPRRLSLDFSDVTDKGFSFDTVRADFQLNNGDAYTSNLLLSGPQAEVGIVGRTGLGKRDYEQTAVVTGDIGGSLSVAGAVVGGPVVGAAVLAFTRLFKEPLKGVTRRYYHISGSWDDPVVERIDKEQAEQSSTSGAVAPPPSETQTQSVSEPALTSDDTTPEG